MKGNEQVQYIVDGSEGLQSGKEGSELDYEANSNHPQNRSMENSLWNF